MIEFIQLNMKKAFVAAVELNKSIVAKEKYIALIRTRNLYLNGRSFLELREN